jgi:succinoglycan biosynthesis transport protein ExoP
MSIIQVEQPGQLQEFVQVLRKRRWQVLLPLATLLTLGVCFAIIVPRKYIVTTQVELRENLFDAGDRQKVSASTSLREAENAPYQIKALARIKSVVDQLKGWTDYMAMSPQDQHLYLLKLQDDIEVTMPRKLKSQGSIFVSISFRHTEPDRAFEFLRGLRTAWIEQEVDRDRTRISAEYQGLVRQEEGLKKEVAREESDFAQLRSAYNISPTQPSPSANQVRIEDPVFARLNEHQGDLAEKRIELSSNVAMVAGIEAQLIGVPKEISQRDIVGGVDLSKELENLNVALLALRSDLAGYGRQHSKYRVIQGEIADKQLEIENASGRVSRGEVREAWAPNEVFLELDSALKRARIEGQVITAAIQELESTLGREAEEAEERQDVYREVREKTAEIARFVAALDELGLRIQHKKQVMDIMNGPAGNPFQITQEVVEPREATEPDPWLLVSISLILGLAVGLGSALMSEYSRSCFRGAGDISRVMIVPVLGVVNHIRTKGAVRRLRWQRALVGTSSFLILGAFVFVTYAWGWRPELLHGQLLTSIEEFRGWFR